MDIEKQYSNEFRILTNEGQLVDGWSNIYQHCKTEAIVAFILSNLLHLSEEDSNILIKAAILHDWYKKSEIEITRKEGLEGYERAGKESFNKLSSMGVEQRIVDIAHSVGTTSLKEISISTDFLKRLMHYIDDICKDDTIVAVNERVDYLESQEKYKELNHSGKAIHNGKTNFQVQRKLGLEIQKQIESILNIKSNSLVPLIQHLFRNFISSRSDMQPNQEYTELNSHIRHYSNMRFAQLTIFLALTGGLIATVFTKIDSSRMLLRIFLDIVGLFLGVIFWIIEESSTTKWKAFKKRGEILEASLGYRQLIEFPESKPVSATVATRILFIGVLFFWFLAILKHSGIFCI